MKRFPFLISLAATVVWLLPVAGPFTAPAGASIITTGDAVDTLWHLQENEDPRIRMAASKSLLDALIKMQNASPKTSTSVRYSVEKTKDG